MPIFSYKCIHCGNKIELLQKIGDPSPLCFNGDCNGEETTKEISGSRISFDFRGSGFYVNDYKAKK